MFIDGWTEGQKEGGDKQSKEQIDKLHKIWSLFPIMFTERRKDKQTTKDGLTKAQTDIWLD